MAEYIKREALIKKIDEGFDKTDPCGEEQIGFLKCRRIAREMPAADVVPVVRCEGCMHRGWVQEPCHGKSVDFCHVWDSCIESIGQCFCSFGERKEGADHGT